MPLDLTPEISRKILTKRGFSPDEYDIDSESGNIIPRIKESPVIQAQPTLPTTVTTPTTPAPPTPLGSGLRKFAAGLLPSGAAIGAGISAASASAPLAAIPFVGPIIPPLIGLGAGIGTSMGVSAAQDAIMPESIKATLATDAATNPLSSMGGELAAGLPFMSPSPTSVIKAGGTLKNILLNPLRAGAAPTTAELGNLANVGVGAGVGTGMSIAGDISNDQPIDWKNAAIQGGANALLNNPTRLSQKLFKATPNADLTRSSEGARAKELAQTIKLNPDSPTLDQDYKNTIRAKSVAENPNSLDARIFKAKTEAEKFDIAETDTRPPRYVSAKDTEGKYTTDTKEIAILAKKHLPSLVDEKGKPAEGLTEDYIRERLDQKLHGKNFDEYKLALEESAALSKKMADEAAVKAREKAEAVSQSVDTYKLDTRRFGDYNAEQKLTDAANATKLKTLQEEAIKAGKKPPKVLPPNEILTNPVAKPVTTTADKARTREANYQAYKNAQAKGDFKTASDYAEAGFLERFQAENSGAVFKPFEPVSNLGLKKIPGTKEFPKQTVPASNYGPQRRTLFQENPAPKYPSADILEQQAEATGKKPELTKAVYDYLAKTFGPLRGVDFKLDAGITDSKGRSVRGLIDIVREGVKKSVARINPTIATPDTVGHEGLHKFIDDLETNGSKQDKQIVAKIYESIADSPEYANFNQRRIASGRGNTSPNEFLTETTGYDVVRRLFNTDNNTGTFRQSWKDLLTAVKVKWGNASREDYNKFLGRRFIEDPSYTETFGGATTTGAAANNISDESNTQQQENKDNYGNIPNNEGQSITPPTKSDAVQNADSANVSNKSAEVLSNKSDYEQYVEVQKKFKAAILAGKELSSPEVQALWKENEVIKNRNGGMPPVKPVDTKFQEEVTTTNEKEEGRKVLENSTGEVTKPITKFQEGEGNDATIPDYDIEKIKATTPEQLEVNLKEQSDNPHFKKENIVKRNIRELGAKLPVIAPALDKLEIRGGNSAKRAVPAIREFFDVEAANVGKYLNPSLEAIRKLSSTDSDLLARTLLTEDSSGNVLRESLPSNLLQPYDTLREILKLKQEDQIKAGQQVLGYNKKGQTFYRDAKISPTYFPQIVSGKTLDVLLNFADTKAFEALKDDFMKLQQTKYELNETQAKAAFDDLIASYGGKQRGDVTGFGAVNKAEGIGLPDSWLETDLPTILRRYWTRTAKARAWHDTIESDDTVNHILGGRTNPSGKPLQPEGNFTPIPGNETLRDVLDNIQGRAVKSSPVIDALSRIASNSILGPMTGINDMISAIPTLAKFIPGMEYIPGTLAAVRNINDGIQHAKNTGRLKENISAMQDIVNPSSNFVENLRGIANTINKVTGREKLETYSRGISQSVSEYLVGVHKTLAASGNTKSKALLTRLANGKDYTALDTIELASRMAQIGQGTYDVRGVPSWMIDSQIAPFFRMSKWSTEQLNNLHKHVIIPASKGDMTPLLMTLGGGIVGGYLAKEVREKVSGKSSPIPSWAEIGASEGTTKDKITAATYNLAAAISHSGITGLMGDLTKSMLDMNYGNAPQGFNYPAFEIISKTANDLAEVHRSIVNDGENPMDVLPQFFNDLFVNNTQVARLASTWKDKLVDGGTELEDKEARRDIRVFKQLHGKPVTPFSGGSITPDYSNSDVKEFKKLDASNIAKAPELLKGIVNKISATPGQTYEGAKSKLSSLRRMPVTTMPSYDNDPAEFVKFTDYLNKTRGEATTKKRLTKYVTQKAANEAKVGLVPKI